MMYVEDISREQLKLLGNILHIWWKKFYVRLCEQLDRVIICVTM